MFGELPKDEERDTIEATCELSAAFLPGSSKCLSFFKSFSSQACRECKLSLKIEKRVENAKNEGTKDINKEFVKPEGLPPNKRDLEKSQDTPNAYDIRVRGTFFKEVGELVLQGLRGRSDVLFQVRGYTKGFIKEQNPKAGARNGTLSWVDLEYPTHFEEVTKHYYYGIRLTVEDESDIDDIKEFLNKCNESVAKIRSGKKGKK